MPRGELVQGAPNELSTIGRFTPGDRLFDQFHLLLIKSEYDTVVGHWLLPNKGQPVGRPTAGEAARDHPMQAPS